MIDSHAHLNDSRFEDQLPEVVARAEEAGVEKIINIGYDLLSSRRAIGLAQEYSSMYAVVGIHPHDAKRASEGTMADLIKLAASNEVVAIGETGLDYHYDNSPRDLQQKVFHWHLEIAEALNLPVVIHSRDATEDTVNILKQHPNNRCLLHCYSGSWETAQIYLAMGYYISFAGPITFKNAHKLRNVAAQVPLDRVLIETDCPYLAPEPHRGKSNEPAFVIHVAEKLAELHETSLDKLVAATKSNTKLFFDL